MVSSSAPGRKSPSSNVKTSGEKGRGKKEGGTCGMQGGGRFILRGQFRGGETLFGKEGGKEEILVGGKGGELLPSSAEGNKGSRRKAGRAGRGEKKRGKKPEEKGSLSNRRGGGRAPKPGKKRNNPEEGESSLQSSRKKKRKEGKKEIIEGKSTLLTGLPRRGVLFAMEKKGGKKGKRKKRLPSSWLGERVPSNFDKGSTCPLEGEKKGKRKKWPPEAGRKRNFFPS